MTTKDGSLILGQSIQVVTPNEEHRVVLDEKSLQEVLLRDDVKDLPVVVVSVAGAHRRSKSLLLNFFLRYLHKTYNESEKGEGDWLGAADETVKRFFGREGSKLTTGIYLWSEPFKASLPSGEKVAVLLMDTQGTSDRTYTVKDNATVFALSTMLSSVLIYNISQNIEEDDLQHLQLFLEYGRVAKDNLVGKPFQRLQFLVRDWSFPHDYPYGPVGGQQLLDKRLKVHEGQHLEQHITGCFEEATCFLMPHPGMKVRTDSHFTGKLSDIDPEYQTHLNQLVPLLLSSENLVQKKIGGQTVKTKDLLSYFKSYVEVFNSDTFQIPTIISESTAEAVDTLMEEAAGATTAKMRRTAVQQDPQKTPNNVFDAQKEVGGVDSPRERLESVEKSYVYIGVVVLVLVLGFLMNWLGELFGVWGYSM